MSKSGIWITVGLISRQLTLAVASCSMLYGIEAKADLIDDILSSTVDAQRRIAMNEARNGKYDAALKLIDEAIAKNGSSPELLSDKTLVLFMADRYKDALSSAN